jgi:hypothetical protein
MLLLETFTVRREYKGVHRSTILVRGECERSIKRISEPRFCPSITSGFLLFMYREVQGSMRGVQGST